MAMAIPKPLRFFYTAMCNQLIERGIITADSKGDATEELRERGCDHVRVRRAAGERTGLLSRIFGSD